MAGPSRDGGVSHKKKLREGTMIETAEERDNYLLLRDGERWAVVERRAGKLYSLRDGKREGVQPGDQRALKALIDPDGWSDEIAARATLAEFATHRRQLAERIW
jgi:hypothetical protein